MKTIVATSITITNIEIIILNNILFFTPTHLLTLVYCKKKEYGKGLYHPGRLLVGNGTVIPEALNKS